MPTAQPKIVKFTNSKASLLLDLLRAVAAFLVVISHWKIMFFINYSQITTHRIWFALPYALSSAGHQAVLIFFILSGYLISGSIFRALDGGFWQWRSYLTHRFTRLYVVLIPGLCLGGLFDLIGLRYSHLFPSLYNGVSEKSHAINIHSTLSTKAFFGNLAYLQTILVPAFGSNGALWSLANEFWYYILFPLGWLALRRTTSTLLRVSFSALFLAIAWFVRGSILELFPVWLAGTLLALLPRLRVGATFRLIATLIYLPLIFAFARLPIASGLLQDYLFGTISFFFVWILLSATEPAGNTKRVHLTRQAARSSYSLYVTHMPALLLLTAFIAGDESWRPDNLHSVVVAFFVLVLVLALAYAFASFTEFHTDRVRRWIETKLDRSLTPAWRRRGRPDPVDSL